MEIEYVTQPVDTDALKNMQGMQGVDEDTLAQMSQVFQHYQISNRDEDEVRYHIK